MPISIKTATAKVHYVKLEIDRAARDAEVGSPEMEKVIAAYGGLAAINELFQSIAVEVDLEEQAPSKEKAPKKEKKVKA